ncbi:MAG: NAD(P)/FAD-dependent oxidoreductase [Candidatus Altiarchaeota archaeon]
MERIKILGGGPSGLTAAINLGKAGFDVDVYEINTDVGGRFHGDLQGLENWSEKEDRVDEFRRMNIKVNFDCYPFSRVTLTNGLKSREVSTPRPLYYLVKRGPVQGSLDQGLKNQALDLGVKIHFKETIPECEADIIATGPMRGRVVGVVRGITFKTDVDDTAILLFNDNSGRKGYSYLLVVEGYGCMCSVVIGEPSRSEECFESTKDFYSRMLDLRIEEPQYCGGVGTFSIKNKFSEGGRLFVGEAAGLQDFLWGFGMRYAVTSGYLAAESIINNEDYEEKAKKTFNSKLKASVVNRFLWEKLGRGGYSPIIDNADFVKSILYSIHNYNPLQRMIYPIALSQLKKEYPEITR